MKRDLARWRIVPAAVFLFGVVRLLGGRPNLLAAKEKNPSGEGNGVTTRLFQLLDNSYEGKLTDFCVLADLFQDPKNPGNQLQHVLKADYDKNHSFGKFVLRVRTFKKIDPEQLKSYTPKQIYEFGDEDSEKFIKSSPGFFGGPGDLYLRASGDNPLASAPIDEEARKAYEFYLTQHLIPALEKNQKK